MKVKINLDTQENVIKLVNIAKDKGNTITVTDNNGLTVNAKSLLGVLYAKMEFVELWLETDNDLTLDFMEFIANE